MAYVERGVVKSKRSIWRLKTMTDFFWSIINFISVFLLLCFRWKKQTPTKKVQDPARSGMEVVLEVLEVVHMVVVHVGHPVGWTMSEALTTVLFLPVVLAVDKCGYATFEIL
uniref:Putative ovule protein n=1 Tax=Solanum chacoense TaxID=4108 RepID=A0A0V0H4S8_SOLCH